MTDFYAQLMQKLLADRPLIPEGNLVEVRFEDLETKPLDVLRTIYETLGLPGFAEAEPRFRSYLESIAGYKKLDYKPDDSVTAKVNEHWGFALDALGYQRIEAGTTTRSRA